MLFVAFVVKAVLSAQAPPQTFRGGVTLINVDVYPRRDGHVVEGLTRADFQILEDGVPQNIDAFEFIRTEPNPADNERQDPRSQRDGDEQAADPHNRVFVVYLDSYHTSLEGANAARVPLVDFLNRTIGKTDLFGVLTPLVPSSQLLFVRRTDTLQAELTKYFDWALRGRGITPVGRPPLEAELQACAMGSSPLMSDVLVELNREDMLMTSLEQLMVRLGGLREARKNVLFISEGWTPQSGQTVRELMKGSESPPPIGQRPGGGVTLDPRRGIGQSQSSCNRQILRLSGIDFEQRFRDLLTLAARANVAFYPVDVAGLRTGLASPREPADVTTLRVLAENTGGMAIVNSNDIRAGFRKIADDLSAYYLLGYSSTNAKLDGKFRRIEVRLKQPGLDVAARRGYMAASLEGNAAMAAAAAATAMPAPIAAELARLSRLRTDAELFSYGAVRNHRLYLVVELSAREIASGRWKTGGDVQVSIDGATGMPPGTARVEADGSFASISMSLPAGSTGPWRADIRVANAGAVLNDRVEVFARPESASSLGNPLLYRGTASPRVPLRPVADFQFRRNERLRAEWPVRDALDSRTARLLDRRGAPLPIPTTITEVDDGAAGRVVSVDVNLAPLAEGDYLVELTAVKGGQMEKGLLAFRVVR